MKWNKKTLFYLTHLAAVVYTLITGDELAQKMALIVLSVWILGWRNYDKV
jgi:hypothetical protein